MSEYTTRQILDMIEAHGGPEGLDISGPEKDLQWIDLSRETIQAELARVRQKDPEAEPVWVSRHTGGVNLRGAYLRAANLFAAKLQGADLEHAKLPGAVLMGANLQRAILVAAHLEGADLEWANLQEADLRYADLTRAYLLDLESAEGIRLYRTIFDHTQLTRHRLGEAIREELVGEWFEAKEAYLALKNNFEQIGRYDDASWAYRKERRMEKRETWQKAKEAFQERAWRKGVSNSLKVVGDQLVQCVCDYGEDVCRVLGWMAVLLFGSPLLFGLLELLDWPDKNAEVFFRLPSPWRYGYAYLQQFLYVLDAFTTASFAELRPAGVWARLLSGLIALVGIFLTGLLGFVAGNRIRRS